MENYQKIRNSVIKNILYVDAARVDNDFALSRIYELEEDKVF
jgi:hypothetical protein